MAALFTASHVTAATTRRVRLLGNPGEFLADLLSGERRARHGVKCTLGGQYTFGRCLLGISPDSLPASQYRSWYPMTNKLAYVAGVIIFGIGIVLIFGFVYATITPSTPPSTDTLVETPVAEVKTKPAKPSKDLKTDAELRARISELESQVKALQAATPARTATKTATAEKAAAVVPVVDRAGWRTIASWRGSGIKSTESFDTSASEWRVTWNAGNGGPFGGVMQIYVNDSNGGLVSVAANTTSSGSDISYVRTRPG